MSLINQYIDALNTWIRTGNIEADPAQKDSYREWQDAVAAQENLVQDLAQQIRAEARSGDAPSRKLQVDDVGCGMPHIGEDCPVLKV
jgi:hypothetical protein